MSLLRGLKGLAVHSPEKKEPPSRPESPLVPPASEATAMQNVALVFLDDPLARKLAVAWTITGGDEEQWFEAAGLSPAQRGEALRICRALRLNGICREGGITDPMALAYIRALVTEPLTKRGGRGKGK